MTLPKAREKVSLIRAFLTVIIKKKSLIPKNKNSEVTETWHLYYDFILSSKEDYNTVS